MLNLKQIAEGWKNVVIKDEDVEAVAKIRLEICRQCPFHSSNAKTKRPDEHCTKCGCPLISKTRCMTCSCPENKWVAHEQSGKD